MLCFLLMDAYSHIQFFLCNTIENYGRIFNLRIEICDLSFYPCIKISYYMSNEKVNKNRLLRQDY